ncbi:MAG: leucyl aminopeptidase family protein, partial [Candidatus Saccharibacteria bacterium]|nr:leucyl aminopeptidase family protein [Pseudorhodobacter sp.]
MSEPVFADAAAEIRTVTVVAAERLADWLTLQPGPVQAWVKGSGFEAGLGDLRLLAGADGAVTGAVAGFGTAATRARGRFGLVKALAGLPGGAWRLMGDLTEAQRVEAALGSLLAQYRFDRYRSQKAATPVTLLPDGLDAARLLAMAEGEFLTRDLINTPAADMGPHELQ